MIYPHPESLKPSRSGRILPQFGLKCPSRASGFVQRPTLARLGSLERFPKPAIYSCNWSISLDFDLHKLTIAACHRAECLRIAFSDILKRLIAPSSLQRSRLTILDNSLFP